MSKPLVLNDFSESGGAINLSFDGLPAAASVHRMNHFRVLSRAVEDRARRADKDEAEAGLKQVVDVRVTCGSFSQTISIPFDLYPLPDALSLEPMNPWSMGVVRIPGANAPLQLQLGNACRPMPAALTLRKFEMVHYPGGSGESGPFRDFRSTLEIASPGGDRDVAVASLNDPVYFDGGKWIFFQAGYDPDGQASTIGVGNRPGVMVMIIGCIMIVVGLMYAFYVKPIVISRMKAAALKKFAGKPKTPKRKTGPNQLHRLMKIRKTIPCLCGLLLFSLCAAARRARKFHVGYFFSSRSDSPPHHRRPARPNHQDPRHIRPPGRHRSHRPRQHRQSRRPLHPARHVLPPRALRQSQYHQDHQRPLRKEFLGLDWIPDTEQQRIVKEGVVSLHFLKRPKCGDLFQKSKPPPSRKPRQSIRSSPPAAPCTKSANSIAA